jgi:hypothetical protein
MRKYAILRVAKPKPRRIRGIGVEQETMKNAR